jgi:hypothetical protein
MCPTAASSLRRRLQPWLIKPWLVALVLGAAACLYAIPLEMLDPTHFGWMNRLDTLAHWLGWEQFRHSPVLQLPLGKSELYGLENSTSIVFSDSIPLVALLLHPIEGLLPRPFQYLGLWTLACFILQAYFAYRLMLRLFPQPRSAMAATLLFLMSAPMLNRIHVHTSLMSHWLVLAGILFYFEDVGWRWRRWTSLLVVAALVHGYLFVMVAALWGAHLLKVAALGQLRGGARALLAAAAGVLAVIVACGAMMWLAGYFGPRSPQLHMYGTGRYDLAGPICTRELWSQVVPSINCKSRANDWDGQSFLGIAILAVLVSMLAGLALRWPRAPRLGTMPRWPLWGVGLFLLAFAVTNDVAFAAQDLFSYPLPRRWLAMAETFRSSGRLIWPVFYLGLFAILAGFVRLVPERFHLGILLPFGLLQFFDVRPGLAAVNLFDPKEFPVARDLPSPAWQHLERYDKLIGVAAVGGQRDWQDLVWQAAKRGMATNIGLFNRTDKARADAGRAHWLRTVTEDRLDPSAVYVIPERELWDALRAHKGKDDVALVADGHFLLFPGGARHGLVDDATQPLPALPLGQWRKVGSGGEGNRYLTNGWSWLEDWGRWNNSNLAGITVRQPAGEVGLARRIVLDVVPYTTRGVRTQRYRVLAWNQLVAEGEIKASDTLVTFDVPGALNRREWLFLELQLPDARLERDGRELALGIRRLWISAQPGTMPSLLSAEQQQMVDAPPPAAYLPDGQWRGVGAEQPGEGYLLSGWSWPEAWGRWSASTRASLVVPQAGELGLPVELQLDVVTHTTDKVPAQAYRASVAGTQVAAGTLGPGEAILSILVPAERTTRRSIVVDLELPDAAESSDGRALAIGLRRLSIRRPPSGTPATAPAPPAAPVTPAPTPAP